MAGVEMLLYMSLLPDGCNRDLYYLMAGVEMLLYMSLLPDGCNRDHFYLMAGVEMLLYMSLSPDGCNRDHYYLMAGVEMLLYMGTDSRRASWDLGVATNTFITSRTFLIISVLKKKNKAFFDDHLYTHVQLQKNATSSHMYVDASSQDSAIAPADKAMHHHVNIKLDL